MDGHGDGDQHRDPDTDGFAFGPGSFLDLGLDPPTSRWANVHDASGNLRGRIYFDPDGLGRYTVTRTECFDDGDPSVAFFHRKPPRRTIYVDAPSTGARSRRG